MSFVDRVQRTLGGCETFALGDITQHGDDERVIAKRQGTQAHLDGELTAILTPPHQLQATPHRARMRIGHVDGSMALMARMEPFGQKQLHRLSQQVGARRAEERFGLVVGEQDVSGGVGHHDGVGSDFQEGGGEQRSGQWRRCRAAVEEGASAGMDSGRRLARCWWGQWMSSAGLAWQPSFTREATLPTPGVDHGWMVVYQRSSLEKSPRRRNEHVRPPAHLEREPHCATAVNKPTVAQRWTRIRCSHGRRDSPLCGNGGTAKRQ